jgi:multidrug resistance efflux pump
MSQSKKPIPIPFARRMQSARSKLVPIMVFGVALWVTATLWRDTVSPAMILGEVATVQSSLTSPAAAVVKRLHIKRLQHIKAGEIILELRPTDTRQTLDLIQSKLGLLRLEGDAADAEQDASITLRREIMDFERLRLDWLVEKVNLATAKAKAKKATIDWELAKGMDAAAASSTRYLQDTELIKQTADAEVAERTVIVETLGVRITELTTATKQPLTKASPKTKEIEALAAQVAAIEAAQDIITLRAPIDGIVTELFRGIGENVAIGETLITITATKPESIIGYLRQPFPIEPTVGQQVEVRTQSRQRLRGLATVTGIGDHFETIKNEALRPVKTAELGLPLVISIPPDLRLRPGEIVSLVLRPAPTPPP